MNRPNQAKPGSTTARGYGRPHQKLRAEVKKLVDRGEAHCWRCGIWLDPALPWDLGHDDQDRSIYRGPECIQCNRSTTRRSRRKSAPRRWLLMERRPRTRKCEICGTIYRAAKANQRTCGRACGWELRRRNAPFPASAPRAMTGTQLSFTVCDICGGLTLIKQCSVDCRRARARNRYRARVGIPIDAPLWSRAPAT